MSSPTLSVEMAQIKLIKSIFMVNASYQPIEDKVAIGVALKSSGEFSEDGWQATFFQRMTTSPPKDAPFFLDIEFNATFVLDPAPLPLEQAHFIRKVFPEIIFPYLREYVAETTRRGGFAPLILAHQPFSEDTDTSTVLLSKQSESLH